MKVELYRHAGYFGRAAALDILVNGQRVTSIMANQGISISLPDEGATLQVVMQDTVSSPVARVAPRGQQLNMECGTPLWVLLDFLSLCYLPLLRQRVFFLREAASA
jgi:hypothetical protein